MLNEDDFFALRDALASSQRLFDKLNNVANQASELDYDESGLYLDEEERLQRHWLKLSSKIVDALVESLDGCSVELLKNDSLQCRELLINLKKDDELSKIKIDYSKDGELNISQLS